MKTTTLVQQTSRSIWQRLVLAVALALTIALFLVVVIPQIKPNFFGSHFEGESGYMAMFIFTPAVMLVLIPLLVVWLRKVSQFVWLGLWCFVQLVLGLFFFYAIFGLWLGGALWLAGLGVLLWKMFKLWRTRV